VGPDHSGAGGAGQISLGFINRGFIGARQSGRHARDVADADAGGFGLLATPWGVLAGVEVVSIAVFGRGVGDIGVSALSGRDCSVVRLDRGQTYCAAREAAPAPGPFCTRSLGTVDCWADPGNLPGRYGGVGDAPPPTAAQERYRGAPWPKALTAN